MTNPSRSWSNALEAFSGVSLYPVDRAPMQSNMEVKPHPSASPAPQKAMSALPSWICSIPVPMQCAPVEHADEMDQEGPWSLKAVARTALTVDPMDLVTRNGPTLFFHRAPPPSTASTVSTMSGMLVPPWPSMPAARGLFWYSSSFSPESSIALAMATYANFAFSPQNRSDALGMRALKSFSVRSGRAWTWERMPRSAASSQKVMPDLHSLRDADTSSRVFPRHDTMPMPVTTTRLRPVTSMDRRVEDAEADRAFPALIFSALNRREDGSLARPTKALPAERGAAVKAAAV
mmetsp:Transcript_22509/g.41928  ORF Transcript_22509/g.41928 Transcript_22509/m.41928 type:complete len:291 (-) Transcript_22509:264-1136(-)